MSNEQVYDGLDADYREKEFERTKRKAPAKRRQNTISGRRGKAPQSFNGIHKRRKRKSNW